MRMAICCSALLALGGTAFAEPHYMHNMKDDQSSAQIIVRINPETRVSAVLGTLPMRRGCGEPVELRVKVINQSGATARLKSYLVDPPGNMTLEADQAALSGRSNEVRTFRLTGLGNEMTDVTIAFSLTGDAGDLADRDRVHMLLRCDRH